MQQTRPIERLVPSYRRDIIARRCNTTFGCGKPATGFRDELSAKEFGISGLCQSCQDAVYQ